MTLLIKLKHIKDISPFRKDTTILLLILILSLPACFNLLLPGYFSMHDDVQIMRLWEMQKCFQDLQIPCRWVPDMGAGFGHPLFNYHPVFAYYVGMFFRVFHISLIETAKILFLLSLILPSIFIYFLAKEFFGKVAALVAAVFFIYAPYHSVEVYVRGALTETWGVVFFPLIFLAVYKFIIEEKFYWFLISVFSLVGLLLAHNIMTLIFVPICLAWIIYWIVITKKYRLLINCVLIFLFAFGISAFFLLPSLLEQPLVKIGILTADYYNFQDHFVTLKQLFFDRHFGYGPSILGANDDLSLQIGWPHWLIALLSLFAIFKLRNKRNSQFFSLVFMFALMLVGIFMTTQASLFIWKSFTGLAFVQFPWRFLAIVMFANSFLVVGILTILKESYKMLFSAALIILVIGLNVWYFHPQKYFLYMTDQKMLSEENFRRQSMATLQDYVPAQVKLLPSDLAPNSPWVLKGKAEFSNFKKNSNSWSFTVYSQGLSQVLIPVFDFPNWNVLQNGMPIAHSSENELGIIQINIAEGWYQITGNLENTQLRSVANLLSLISASIILLLTMVMFAKKMKLR